MRTYGRLVVHAGLHRTGTTSLQYQLPSIVDERHVRLRVPEVHPNRPLLKQVVMSDLSRDLATFHGHSALTMVISNESLLGHFSDGYADGPARCRELAQLLPSSSDVTPVVVVRPFIDWLESGYRASVREGSELMPEEYADRVLASPWSSWPRLAEDFLSHFRPTSPMVLPLPRGMDSTALLVDAFELPLQSAERPQRKRLNRSLSAPHIAWLRAMNATGDLQPHQRNVIVDVLQTDFAVAQAPDSVFSAGLRRQLEERSTSGWRDLLDLIQESLPGNRTLREWTDWDLEHTPKAYGGVVHVGDPAVSAMVSYAGRALVDQAGRRASRTEKLRDGMRRGARAALGRRQLS